MYRFTLRRNLLLHEFGYIYFLLKTSFMVQHTIEGLKFYVERNLSIHYKAFLDKAA